MTNKQFAVCVSEAVCYSDRDAYISDLCLSTIWGDSEESGVPADRITAIGDLWDALHRNVREISEAAGLSNRKLAERFCIPYRTMENWCGGKNDCPLYTRLMMQECLGLLQIRHDPE